MTTHSAAAEQKAILAETDQPERKSVVDDFAGYRALRRRVDDMEGAGLDNPFFQPRDGVSHSVIRRNEKSLVSFSGYNYLGLNGHPAVTAAAKNAIDKYGTSASASRSGSAAGVRCMDNVMGLQHTHTSPHHMRDSCRRPPSCPPFLPSFRLVFSNGIPYQRQIIFLPLFF